MSLRIIRHSITTSLGTYTHAMVFTSQTALLFWSTGYQRWWPCESARAAYGLAVHALADEFNRNWRVA